MLRTEEARSGPGDGREKHVKTKFHLMGTENWRVGWGESEN